MKERGFAFALMFVAGFGLLVAFVCGMVAAGLALLNHANVATWTGGTALIAGGLGAALAVWVVITEGID